MSGTMSFLNSIVFFIGFFCISVVLVQSLRFIAFHGRNTDLQRFRYGKAGAWAVITGGGGGIGFGYSLELCRQGFNVVLVGHLKSELEDARDMLLKQSSSVEVRYIILDAAAQADYDTIANAMSQLSDLNITVLINNVGGAVRVPFAKPFSAYTPEDIDSIMNINTRFMIYLTRILLPTFLANKGPSLIINMSSASRTGMPYSTMYSATKAFIATFTKSLAMELRAEGHTNIKITAVVPADVQSGGHNLPSSWTVPTSARFAKLVLDKVEFAKDIVIPFWPHALMLFAAECFPDWLHERMLVRRVRHVKRYL